ncbi:NAD-dependent epimerase/dehydratase family protein [Halovivax limisalsi]|uniref:NAD-dependent epimerase/dehydratase family protein n=1 Tax=Halovivax limisalsi TaxID=1453760 RepID=UPI001FFC6872|nr:NAD-dependent epimerase/dehydratase family protein [Halovivax limisalsi]
MQGSLQNATALVTGAAGFVGCHLVEELVETNTVIAFDHFRSNDRDRVPDEAIVFEGDVRDEAALREAMTGVDVVFHLAATSGDEATRSNPRASHATTVGSTLTVLELARELDVRVVVATSAALYGDGQSDPVSESGPTAPVTLYGEQELLRDHYTRLWCERYDVETVALRYFNIFGPDATDDSLCGLLGAFLEQLDDDGAITVYGDGSQTRDFVHVSDVVRATMRAATTTHVGEAFNVGSGEAASVGTLARLVRDRVDPGAEIVYESDREVAVQESQADITNAQERLGYEPTMALEECLSRMAVHSEVA